MGVPIRSPRSATHALGFESYNGGLFFSRRGCLVYEFSMGRGQWFLTKHRPEILLKCKRLNVFEMHPETAMERLRYQ